MKILTLREAYNLAGVDRGDNDMERDLKFSHFFDRYRIRVVEHSDVDTTELAGIDFLIIKE